ncbi:uncharacterized protein LOC131843779 [Achroia grisella]|uniref:uncharacterized protein LOC131843779 n=1 Tax=Achroia grisella TaxID=688607 RepID=UPI0027D2DEA3|nr:uncharacterized protein LOC131843779 [Achroia grisella]
MRRTLLILMGLHLVNCLPPPHPAVVQVLQEERQLPPYMRSRALQNPHLLKLLSLTSLLHKGEKLVHEREADDVSRREIYNILTHAGLISRNQFHRPPEVPHHRHQKHPKSIHSQSQPHVPHQQQFDEHFLLSSPDVLQHL